MPDEAVKEAAAEIFQRPRLTNKERLAVECLKPRSVVNFNSFCREIQTLLVFRYRAPCGPYQKHKCVRHKSSGEWRMKKCRHPSFSGHREAREQRIDRIRAGNLYLSPHFEGRAPGFRVS